MTTGSSAGGDRLVVPSGGDGPRTGMGDPARLSVNSCAPNSGSSSSSSGNSIEWQRGRVWCGGVRDGIRDGIAPTSGSPSGLALLKFSPIWSAPGGPKRLVSIWEGFSVVAVREGTMVFIARSTGPGNTNGWLVSQFLPGCGVWRVLDRFCGTISLLSTRTWWEVMGGKGSRQSREGKMGQRSCKCSRVVEKDVDEVSGVLLKRGLRVGQSG